MSNVFDLDDVGARAQDEYARLNPLDPALMRPAWAGLGEAGKGLLYPSAQAARALTLAGAALPLIGERAVGLVTGEEPDSASNWYFRNVVEEFGQEAVDYWKPNPAAMGSASKLLNVGSTLAGSIPQLVGTPAVFLGTQGIDPAAEVIDQGGSVDTALGVGAINLAANAVGFRIPAAFGNTLLARTASGAAANLAVGAASDAGTAAVLRAGDMEEMAAAYDWTDPTARGLDALLGAAFGYKAHLDALPTMPQAQRDAALATNNNDHLTRRSAPGQPADAAAARAHAAAMNTALEQVLASQPIDVATQVGERVQLADAAPSGYGAYRRALESGGRADARNPASSAAGIDQFTAGTWRRIVAKAKPAWAEGLSDAELLAARMDPAKSGQMVAALDAENTAALGDAGLAVDEHSLYAMHHFGPAAGKKFARADGDVAMEQILSGEQLAANPYLQGKTKAQALAEWDARAKRAGVNTDGSLVDTNEAGQALRRRLNEEPDRLVEEYAALEDSHGGTVLNTDVARELSPEYLADRTRSADVHEAASDFVKALYARKLAAPTPEGYDRRVLFTAGGTGAGKTSALTAMGDSLGRPEIVYDTNMNTLRSAEQKVQQALAAGRDVTIAYVYRDPVEALTGGAIPRAQRQAERFGTGRTVPLEEHARTHLGVRSVMESLADRYANDSRVTMVAIDNSRGKGQQNLVDLASLPRVEQNDLRGRLQEALEEARAAGLSEDLYRGFGQSGRGARDALAGDRRGDQASPGGPEAGTGAGGQPQSQRDGGRADAVRASETPLEAATRLATESPDAMVLIGEDADGQARYVPISQALAEIEADRLRAANDAEAYSAAANCFIRRGA